MFKKKWQSRTLQHTARSLSIISSVTAFPFIVISSPTILSGISYIEPLHGMRSLSFKQIILDYTIHRDIAIIKINRHSHTRFFRGFFRALILDGMRFYSSSPPSLATHHIRSIEKAVVKNVERFIGTVWFVTVY